MVNKYAPTSLSEASVSRPLFMMAFHHKVTHKEIRVTHEGERSECVFRIEISVERSSGCNSGDGGDLGVSPTCPAPRQTRTAPSRTSRLARPSFALALWTGVLL